MQLLASMKSNFNAIVEVFTIVRQHRRLTEILVRREFTEPYAGLAFGWFWAFIHPFFLMLMYTVVFNLIFQARIGGTQELPLDYTVYILSGLVPWLTFQQALVKGVQSISGNSILVKQVVFPVETLPVRAALSSLLVLLVGTAFLFIYIGIKELTVWWTYALIPLLALLMAMAMIGMAFALSAVAVFVRDTRDFVQLFTVVNIFLIPAIYLPAWVPPPLMPILYLNPFSYLIWCSQDIFYFGRIDHPWSWVIFATFSVFSLAIGYRIFRHLRPAFGNFL